MQVIAFQFKLSGHFTAFPVRLTAVTHQKIKSRFLRFKRIVLTQITDLQMRTVNDLTAVQFFVAQQNLQQRRLAGPVASHKADFHAVMNGAACAVQQQLIAVAFDAIK